jgi:Cdc6-like AAA superfamily ATPase
MKAMHLASDGTSYATQLTSLQRQLEKDGLAVRDLKMTKKAKVIEEKLSKLNQIFTPSSPIETKDLFAGRMTQVKRTLQALTERGQHAVLYGERGVGKTSLANIIDSFLEQVIVTARVTCNRTDLFGTLWKKVFSRVSLSLSKPGFGFDAKPKEIKLSLEEALPKEDDKIEPSHILDALEKISRQNSEKLFLFIFDEFDSLANTATKTKFADTLKSLSDNCPTITILLVGIAENVTHLIGDHRSLERCLKQIRVPRMLSEEIEEIVDKGIERLGIKISEGVKLDIVDFSEGFPHYTHLLAKYAAQTAIMNDSSVIESMHLKIAVEEAIANAQESIRDSYHRAVLHTRQSSMFRDVVSACALVEEDEYGTFKPTDLQEALHKLTGEFIDPKSYRYHLGKLCQEEKGLVLQKVGSANRYRYRFTNPLLKAFVRLKLYQQNKISCYSEPC